MNRSFRKKIVDLVGQCGIPRNPVELDSSVGRAGLGFKKNRFTEVGRYSRPLPFREVYRITHEPAPPPTNAAQVFVSENLGRIENTKLDYAFHPTIHLTTGSTVLRPRLPILCMKETLQDKIYEPSTFEEREGHELPSELTKRRPNSARTWNPNQMRVREPVAPFTLGAPRARTARRPNSNNDEGEEDDYQDSVEMSKFNVGKIDEELIRNEREIYELKRRYVREEDKEPDYVVEEPKEEEKQPVNWKILYIRKLLRRAMRDDYYEEEEEEKEENQKETEEQTETQPQSEEQTETQPQSEEQTENLPQNEEQTENLPQNEEQTETQPQNEEQTETQPQSEEQTENLPQSEEQTENPDENTQAEDPQENPPPPEESPENPPGEEPTENPEPPAE